MRKSMYKLAASTIGVAIAVIVLATGCETSSANRADGSKAKVNEAQADLDKANQEYLADMKVYRRDISDRIASNEQSIADFNARVELEKGDARETYKKTVSDLEHKNREMKKRIDDYQADGKDNWLKFKTEFNRDMDNLGKAFTDLGKDNVKGK